MNTLEALNKISALKTSDPLQVVSDTLIECVRAIQLDYEESQGVYMSDGELGNLISVIGMDSEYFRDIVGSVVYKVGRELD